MPASPTSLRAIFARNHAQYLTHAVAVAAADPAAPVTFRSNKKWASALQLLTQNGEGAVPVYFAVVGDGPEVRYKAWLKEIVTEPRSTDPAVVRMLGVAAKGTEAEGVWIEGAGSIYSVAGCYELPRPFPLSELRKSGDGTPLSNDFNYSYALVQDVQPAQQPARHVATDLPPPPARVEARQTRIVRDTGLVRRLKQLHDDTCQLCGTRLIVHGQGAYSEGHHLQPLGTPHNGCDVAENVLVVCPNCHAVLDLAGRTISLADLRLRPGHGIHSALIDYHNGLVASRWTT